MQQPIVTRTILRAIAAAGLLAFLAACGGGGGGLSTPPPPPPPPTSSWQPGVFLPAGTFQNRCVAPRTGTDPATNQPFPDVAGTVLDENNFLRSFSDDTYLWYDEITDQDPATFDDPLAYFDELKTFATTASGADRDKFHFTVDSQEWFDLTQGGVSAGYGAIWAIISATVPREIVVAYTEPGSPATAPAVALLRGTRLLAIDGFDIDTNTQAGIDALNAALFPSDLGESHDFVVQDVGAGVSRNITMVSTTITNAMVQNTQVIATPTGMVGYMTFNFHRAPAESELIDAINFLNTAPGITDLVLDIRYNGGGFLDIAGQLAYMIAGDTNTAGRSFETLQFNDKHPVTNPITGVAITPTPFHTTTLGFSVAAGQALPTLDLSRVYVLTGPGTCSASEAIMNGLRGANVEVIQIGSRTCGKPYGFFEIPNCGTSYFTIQFRGVNDQNFGDYTDGFVPSAMDDGQANILGCQVSDDYTKPLGDVTEDRLEVALAHRAGGACIVPSAVAAGVSAAPTQPPAVTDGVVYRSPFDSNRILRRPQQ